jgi:putative endonuclease
VKPSVWHFYVLLCSDGSYYAGVTTNVDRRLHEHNNTKRGAKYTRPRRPVELIISERYQTRSLAQKAERYFKTLTRKQKEGVIGNASR